MKLLGGKEKSKSDIAIEPDPVIMYDRLHRGGYTFKKNIRESVIGYTWYIPKVILPYIYFDKGMMKMKEIVLNESNYNIWNAAKIIQGVFNIDMNYFKYKRYLIVFLKKNQTIPTSLLIPILFGSRKKINIIISMDSTKYGFENQLPFYHNKVNSLLH